MLIRHVAIISQTKHVEFGALTDAAAALQKQVTRDFSPLWGVSATVDAFEAIEQAPIDYWHILIRDDIERPDESGFHTTQLNQPVAFVQFDDDWTITASHETLEMLADPFGNSIVAGDSPRRGQGRVQFIQEICDPCRGSTYSINGAQVSDFCTPQFYDPVASPGVRYSYTGAITGPRQSLRGGYLTFIDPVSGQFFQQRWFDGDKPVIVDLSSSADAVEAMVRRPGESLRQMVDRSTPRPRSVARRNAAAKTKKRKGVLSREAHARSIHGFINDVFRRDSQSE